LEQRRRNSHSIKVDVGMGNGLGFKHRICYGLKGILVGKKVSLRWNH
jgi:hypothetical protein